MTHQETADLLNRAATRLTLAYFAELEKERDCRWDGDDAQADSFRDEAENILALAEQCRAAARRLSSDDTIPRTLSRRHGGDGLPIAPH